MWNLELLLTCFLTLELVGCCIKVTRKDDNRRASDTFNKRKYSNVRKNRKHKRSVWLNIYFEKKEWLFLFQQSHVGCRQLRRAGRRRHPEYHKNRWRGGGSWKWDSLAGKHRDGKCNIIVSTKCRCRWWRRALGAGFRVVAPSCSLVTPWWSSPRPTACTGRHIIKGCVCVSCVSCFSF